MERTEQRRAAIAACVARLRELEADLGVNEEFLTAAKDEVRGLVDRRELFGWDEFPRPPEGRRTKLYELSMGDDDRFAVYLMVTNGWMRSRPHDHGTWVVTAGLAGVEHQRIYARRDDGAGGRRGPLGDEPEPATLEELGRVELGPGVVSAILPSGIHSLEIPGDDPSMGLQIYGHALHTLGDRRQFDVKKGWAQPMPTIERRIAERAG
ncbi:MAG: hypothetical protein ACKVWR_01300 [Acidimicrobiales bacterium]